MKRTSAAAVLLVSITGAYAQLPDAGTTIAATDSVISIVENINTSGNISIEQPENLARMLVRVAQPSESDAEAGTHVATISPASTRGGYRVQVFDDNNPRTARAQSEARRRQIVEAFPQWPCYVSFNSPYWQVRVGDFTTRGQAEAALAEIRDAFPATSAYIRVVRDKINIE